MEIVKTIKICDILPFYLVGNTEKDRFVAPVIKKNGFWEALETLVALQLVKKGDVALDIGANIGYFSLLLSQAVGDSGQIYAYEPDSENYRLLKANKILNNCSNLNCLNQAISKEDGFAKLFLSTDNLGDHRLFETPGRDSCEVQTTSLDSKYSETHVDFIKLDTQGSECNILSGMTQTVQHNRSHLSCLMEFSPKMLQDNGFEFEMFHSIVKKLDARFYLPVPNGMMISTNEKGAKSLYNSEKTILEKLETTSLRQLFEYMCLNGYIYQDLVVFFSDIAEEKYLSKFQTRPFSGYWYF